MHALTIATLAMAGAVSLAAQIDLDAVRGIERFPGDADARAKLALHGFVTLPGIAPAMGLAFRRSDLPPLVTVDVALHAVIAQQRAMLREIESQLAPVLAAFCARGYALASARADESAALADAARFFGLARLAHGDGWQPAGAPLGAATDIEGPWQLVRAASNIEQPRARRKRHVAATSARVFDAEPDRHREGARRRDGSGLGRCRQS